VAIELEGKLELGSDAIGSGDQHRLAKAVADLDQTAKAADSRQNFGDASYVWRMA
jgi:hypothetical protein